MSEASWKLPRASQKILLADRIRTIARIAISVLSGILALELGFHLFAAPNLRLQKIVFEGNAPVNDAQVTKLLELGEHEYYFSVDETRLTEKLRSIAWVKTATVQKVFPDTLKVKVAARQPLALSLVQPPSGIEGAKTAVLLVDAQGVVFDVRANVAGIDLPVVSGVQFEAFVPGARFPEVLLPLFRGLEQLRTDAPGLFRMISEIQLKKNDRGSFDATFYPLHSSVRVVLGDDFNESVLRQVFVLLDIVSRERWTGKTKEIDFRTTPVVLRTRGEH